jgi:hypothetical protein
VSAAELQAAIDALRRLVDELARTNHELREQIA